MSSRRPLPLPYHSHHTASTQKIPQTKQDIYNFSDQIVVDITHLAEVFGETGGGRLSQKAWEDLQETRWAIGKLYSPTQRCLPIVSRDLVNKTCKWAYDGLVSLVFRQQNRVLPNFHFNTEIKKCFECGGGDERNQGNVQ